MAVSTRQRLRWNRRRQILNEPNPPTTSGPPLDGWFSIGDGLEAQVPPDSGNLRTDSVASSGQVAIRSVAHVNEVFAGSNRYVVCRFWLRGLAGRSITFTRNIAQTSPNANAHNSGNPGRMLTLWMRPPGGSWTRIPRDPAYGTNSTVPVFTPAAAFTDDAVEFSSYPDLTVGEYYSWVTSLFSNPLVKPLAGGAWAGDYLVGVQGGRPSATTEVPRVIEDLPLYGFRIYEGSTPPNRLLILATGQHPFERLKVSGYRTAINWLLSSDATAVSMRENFTVLCYPHINPTGHMAGLWRGPARTPNVDTNRNWDIADTNATGPGDTSVAGDYDTILYHRGSILAEVGTQAWTTKSGWDLHGSFDDHYMLHPTGGGANYTAFRDQMRTLTLPSPQFYGTASSSTTSLPAFLRSAGPDLDMAFTLESQVEFLEEEMDTFVTGAVAAWETMRTLGHA